MVAREEERRRLRADLHDGVAPALAGTALQLESLARKLQKEGQPELADRALGLRDGAAVERGASSALSCTGCVHRCSTSAVWPGRCVS